jgi:hypothetical protein
MKLFHRKLSERSLPAQTEATENQSRQPEEHIHPNYRHWSWFRPTHLNNGDKR